MEFKLHRNLRFTKIIPKESPEDFLERIKHSKNRDYYVSYIVRCRDSHNFTMRGKHHRLYMPSTTIDVLHNISLIRSIMNDPYFITFDDAIDFLELVERHKLQYEKSTTKN